MMRSSDAYSEVIAYLNSLDENTRRRHPHRLPHERYTESENEFFFTICARHQYFPFIDDILARMIIAALMWYRGHYGWYLFCYCLMPDHLHFILRLPDTERRLINAGARGMLLEGVLEQVGYFKSYTTSQCWWKLGGMGQLWQTSSYDRIIRDNNSAEEAVFYVLNNPLRKNLVEIWDQYPYSAIVDPI
jgi:REP element-mobilizing transposase RayT